ncbi:hypothetical protein J6590_044880 [Homalodisca vitripennis]|nr:hypothetical protein J6590_044880 [Homalodisca vitripennis]
MDASPVKVFTTALTQLGVVCGCEGEGVVADYQSPIAGLWVGVRVCECLFEQFHLFARPDCRKIDEQSTFLGKRTSNISKTILKNNPEDGRPLAARCRETWRQCVVASQIATWSTDRRNRTSLIATLLAAPPHHAESPTQGLDMHYLLAQTDSVPNCLTMLLSNTEAKVEKLP